MLKIIFRMVSTLAVALEIDKKKKERKFLYLTNLWYIQIMKKTGIKAEVREMKRQKDSTRAAERKRAADEREMQRERERGTEKERCKDNERGTEQRREMQCEREFQRG